MRREAMREGMPMRTQAELEEKVIGHEVQIRLLKDLRRLARVAKTLQVLHCMASRVTLPIIAQLTIVGNIAIIRIATQPMEHQATTGAAMAM